MESALYGIYELVELYQKSYSFADSLVRLIFSEWNYWGPHPNLEEIEKKKKRKRNSCFKCVLQNTLHDALPSKS